MFSQTETLERRDFSVLHKIVLGIIDKNLEAELVVSTADINTMDSLGRTPISLAAERGDAKKVSMLLWYGADPHIPAYSGSDPLCYAAKVADPACISLLLNAGAKVDCRTGWDQTALHYAAAHNSNRRHTELLLAAGADPNSADRDGRTPLGFTPVQDHLEVAACLLEYGANIRNLDTSGIDPLVLSIETNRHRLLDLFIRHGFRVDTPLRNGKTLFHIIASAADEGTMRLFSRVDLSGIPLGQVDDEGRRALEIVRCRPDSSPELLHSFYELLERPCSAKPSEHEEEQDVWDDALESLDS
jgi:ankyrin repeat protein